MNDGWDYIALGHYHLYTKLDDNVYYSGSLEFSSSNIWEEIGKPKGFIELDLDERRLVDFHKVNTREVVDLRSLDASDKSAAELNQLIMHRVEGISGGHADKIVRLVIENVSKAVLPDLDYRTIRQVRNEALHFDLSLRPAKRVTGNRTPGETGAARPLEDEWREFAAEYEVPTGVNRAELATIGAEYLESVTEK
jgi:DNA repair exonuclease SbcCD nuclease subunit